MEVRRRQGPALTELTKLTDPLGWFSLPGHCVAEWHYCNPVGSGRPSVGFLGGPFSSSCRLWGAELFPYELQVHVCCTGPVRGAKTDVNADGSCLRLCLHNLIEQYQRADSSQDFQPGLLPVRLWGGSCVHARGRAYTRIQNCFAVA